MLMLGSYLLYNLFQGIANWVMIGGNSVLLELSGDVQPMQGETFASTENQGDNTHAWIFGGGFQFPFTGNLSMMSIDVGAKYFTGGRATYLREGAIQDNPDGSVSIFFRSWLMKTRR